MRCSVLFPLATIMLSCAASVAHAEEREFCADRPGLGTPSCTMAPGEAMVEVGAVAWEHTRDPASIEDQVTLGDALLRIGIADSAEVQLAMTSHVIDRTRDRLSGTVDRITGAGDATLAVRRGLAGSNGPVALQAFVTLPVGKEPLGAARVTGGVLLASTIPLSGDLEAALTPEIDLSADSEGVGRHLTWGGVVGLTHPLAKSLDATLELGAFRDEDPGDHTTDARAALSLAWQVQERFQLDLEVDAGLNRDTPDHAILIGFARRFR